MPVEGPRRMERAIPTRHCGDPSHSAAGGGFLPATSRRNANPLSFNPWHALAEHRPLGGMNRLRKVAYAASIGKRGGH